MGKKRRGLGDFFRGMSGTATEAEKEKELLSSLEETIRREESSVEESAAPDSDAARLHEIKGALLKVWQNWTGGTLAPTLSLAGKKSVSALPLDSQAMDRERVRLMVQLEQDAKKRLKEIEDMEKRGDTSLDAVCRVHVSKDKMVAWVFLFPPVGEGDLPPETLGRVIQDNGITTGIDTETMMYVFQNKPYFELLPIALGTPAEEGSDGSVIEHYSREISMEVKLDENGMADYRTLNYVRQVMKDDIICDILPPVPGKSGVRVDGKVVEPKPVKAAKVPSGVNTTITEDGAHLVATRDGHLEFAGDAFQVRPLLEIKGDVDYSTGNIEFTGDVHIAGDVRENFVVHATGTVTVDGLVEAAIIEAGGDLVITRGVVGDNRAMLRSKGCVRVKYLENCVVYAGKCVYADCIMTSQIFSDDAIDVTSGRGSVIGGAMTAAHSIRAKMIGAQSGRKTKLTMGMLPYVQSELQNVGEDMDILRREWDEVKKEIAYLEEREGLEGISAKLAKVRMRKSVLAMKERQLRKRQERLEPLTPDLSKCRLECDVIYPVTTLSVQDANWVVTDVKRHCKVIYDEHSGELKEIY